MKFLIYRVELKVSLSVISTNLYLVFLIYRVELKEALERKTPMGNQQVPNLPCGVESHNYAPP